MRNNNKSKDQTIEEVAPDFQAPGTRYPKPTLSHLKTWYSSSTSASATTDWGDMIRANMEGVDEKPRARWCMRVPESEVDDLEWPRLLFARGGTTGTAQESWDKDTIARYWESVGGTIIQGSSRSLPQTWKQRLEGGQVTFG